MSIHSPFNSMLLTAPLASWTVETDELGYARLHGIRVSRAGQHVIQFVATLWQDTRLEVLSAPFEIVPGPAVSAVFSLKPPPRVLLREPFSAVATLVDSEGNETANASKLQRAGDHVEVHLIALNDAGQKVPLHGQTSRVWGGGKLAFEGLWFSEPGRVLLKASPVNELVLKSTLQPLCLFTLNTRDV